MRFIDLQVNGYAGVDFNGDDLSADALHYACETLRQDGVEGILATIISDDLPILQTRLARLAALHEKDPLVRELVQGIHLEGPFLNESPGYAGAHPTSALRFADAESMNRLLGAGRGLVRLVTLAPERDPEAKITRFLADRKILVAAGHCDCSRDELRAAIDNGLRLFTHLGNACPAMLPRHDNIIERALSLREHLQFTFIADGVHIPLFVLKNYLDLVGVTRAIIVTDAMAAARLGPGCYTLGSQTVNVGEDLAARSDDGTHLMGSTATMPGMTHLLQEEMQFTKLEIEQMVFENPKKLLMLSARSRD